jgi:acetate kinase
VRESSSRLILTINTGSSSLKVAAYRASSRLACEWQASISRIGSAEAEMTTANEVDSSKQTKRVKARNQAAALDVLMAAFSSFAPIDSVAIIGHRVVHGGPIFTKPCRISKGTLVKLEKLEVLAPDHMPQALAAIRFFRSKVRGVPQMAAFDTAFHANLPDVARNFAIAPRYARAGMHRYGFHGLSYTYVLNQLKRLEPRLWRGRVVIAHLGSGASMAAIRNGRSVDTSMGFSPDSGLIMGTRAGDIDAALTLYLIEEKRQSPQAVRMMLNHESGLKAISGRSADMQTLLEQSGKDLRSRAAIEQFCYRAKHYLGAYASVLGGIDMLVFTGGIGENAPKIRAEICSAQEFLGISIDRPANQRSDDIISSKASKVCVRVVPTDEDFVIASQARALLRRA